MAVSKCPHCNGTSFELKEVSPTGSKFKQNFVQCASCGAPMGVLEYFALGQLIKNQEKEVEDLKRQVSSVAYQLTQVLQVLRQR